MPHFKMLSKRNGFSLIEIMIAIGLLSVISLAVMSLLMTQQKESKSLTQKLGVLGLEKLLITTLADGSVCTFEMTNGTPKTFDSTNPAAEINFSTIHSAANAAAPPIITVGVAFSDQVKVSSIKMKNIVSTGNPDEWLADLEIAFDSADLVRPFKPITIRTIIRTTGPANNKTVTMCATSTTTRMERYMFHYGPGVDTTNTFYCNPTCSWTVPLDLKGAALISIAGGGASAMGPKVVNSSQGGNSGGYLMSAPVTLAAGAIIPITIGAGGRVLDDPSFITGSPGKESSFGSYIVCSGGGVGSITYVPLPSSKTALYEYGSPGLIDGLAHGVDSSNPAAVTTSDNPSTGIYGTSGPGFCGPNKYGLGNIGTTTYDGGSGTYAGGTTPFGYGSGGSDSSSGAAFNGSGTGVDSHPYLPTTVMGTKKGPKDGREGVVIIDVLR